MKQKIFFLLTIALVFLSVGVLAERTLTNLEGISVPLGGNVIAGNTFQVNFSYMYLSNNSENTDDSPLILNLSFLSDNSSYPVWKNDFKVDGIIKRFYLWDWLHLYSTIPFNCSEKTNQKIVYPVGTEDVVAPNGTFYCYNATNGDLKLDKGDKITLNINSNYALYPGGYNLTAKLYYLNDTYPPVVNITNKEYFETHYFREGNNIEIIANITDVNLNSFWASIPIENTSINGNLQNDSLYRFPTTLSNNIPEGNWEMNVYATDTNGNLGQDNTTLKIDNTGPNITLVEPGNASIYDQTIPIKLNVTDEKSGVNDSSVKYKISEIINGTFCPNTGIIFGNFSCFNSGWIPTTLNTSSGYYEDIFNATNLTSGSYYFESEAKDILGNEGVL